MSPAESSQRLLIHTLKPLLMLALASAGTGSLCAQERGTVSDQRSRIVESTLRDLSRSNEAASARGTIEPGHDSDAMGMPKISLEPREQMEPRLLIQKESQSSLHKLYRETANKQIRDGRQARVEESLDRMASEQAAGNTP